MSLAGARATWANYTLDGITNTDVDFNTYIVLPSVDALQEFKVQSGIYPAEFGREAGQINVSTKAGTNSYHGAVFEFLRNNTLDARSYDFLSSTRSATNPSPPSTPYRQNQYGFTLGGPVRIPKIFNGKNRLFFMSNFEGFKSRTTSHLDRHDHDRRRCATATSRWSRRCCRTRSSRTERRPTSITVARIPDNKFRRTASTSRRVYLMSNFFPLPNLPAAPGSATAQLPIPGQDAGRQGPVQPAHRLQRELEVAVVRPL